jgi:hypothetical protein
MCRHFWLARSGILVQAEPRMEAGEIRWICKISLVWTAESP